MSHDVGPQLAFGCANVGIAWRSREELQALSETLGRLNVNRIDTAARYPPSEPGLAEKLLGEAEFTDKGFEVNTKIFIKAGDGGGSMSEEAIRTSIENSLKALKATKVNTLYCHGPDRVTPIAVQAAAVHKYNKQRLFSHLGVSNFDSAMLEEWLKVADVNGYVKPTIYQGQYNLLCRGLERNILPLLRKHGIAFSAFSPLAGGFMTGKLTFAAKSPDSLKGTRFETASDNPMGKAFRHWYDKDSMHAAMRDLSLACEQAGVLPTSAALRWLAFHSKLGDGDEIVFGATQTEQIEAIVEAISTGPLPSSLADRIEGLWECCREDGMAIVEY